MNNSSVPLEQRYYFNAVVDAPLSFKHHTLREESAYDADSNTEITALKFIEKVSICSKENIYLIIAGNDIAPSNGLRTKKGVLWGESKLKKLDHRNFEVIIDENNTRLMSIVDLKDFSYDSPSKVLNWMSCMLLLSNLNLDKLAGLVSEWVSKDRKSALPYNYDAVAKTLHDLESTAVLRYFPADNGKSESLVAVGQSSFLEGRVGSCIQSLI